MQVRLIYLACIYEFINIDQEEGMGPRLALLGMIVFALAAFITGPIFHRDRTDANVPQESVLRLRTFISSAYTIRPYVLQITEAHKTGPSLYDVKGTGVWRTLFGISVGMDQVVYDGDMAPNLNLQKWLIVWVIFLGVEGALGSYIVWWIRRYWW